MRKLSEPINGTETYLAAIHEVLCDIRTALVDGGKGQSRFISTIAGVDEEPAADALHYADGGLVSPEAVKVPGPSVTPTKRTRQRPPRGS